MSPTLNALKVAAVLAVSGSSVAAAQAAPLSNQEFAAQVRAARAQIAASTASLEQAATLCVHLPPHRSAEEPQCVALRLHLKSAGLSASRLDALAGCTRSAISGVLHDLAALVRGAA